MNPALIGAIFVATNQIGRRRREEEAREELRVTMMNNINDWWNSWHRFAEEDELPPMHIEDMLYRLNTEFDMQFDLMTGTWTSK